MYCKTILSLYSWCNFLYKKRQKIYEVWNAYLFFFVVVAGKRVRQCLQCGIGKASEGRHSCDQQDALRQADDQSGDGEAHHAAQIDRPGPKETH